MKRKRKKSNFRLDTLIGSTAIIEGRIFSERSVYVEGIIRGSISANAEVMVGRHGEVGADIHGQSVVVGGRVTGNIVANRRLKITATGRVTGDITAPMIAIEEGGVLNGLSNMKGEIEAPYTRPEQMLPVWRDGIEQPDGSTAEPPWMDEDFPQTTVIKRKESRRRYPRLELAIRVPGDKDWMIRDLSPVGCYIETSHPLDSNSEVGLRFQIPLKTRYVTILAESIVLRNEPGGMAIEFTDLDSSSFHALEEFIETIH